MLLGVLLHAGLAYAEPAQAIWLATDTKSSVAIDASIWFIHLFRMSLFYLLSGYFAKLVIQRKGIAAFLKNRSIRLLVPFLLFLPPLTIAMMAVIVFSMSYIAEPRGLMQLIRNSAPLEPESGAPAIRTMHLWFIYYLMFFSLLAAVFSRWDMRWIDKYALRPIAFFSVVPILLATAVWQAGAPLPAPEAIVPTWWPFVFYGLFFASGWKLYGHEKLLEKLSSKLLPLALAAMALYLPYYWLIPTLDVELLTNSKGATLDGRSILVAILTAYLSILWTIIALVAGHRFLSCRSQLLSFISDASYWIYLTHLPIVLFLQTLLVPLNWPVWIKLGIVLSGTLLPTFLSYLIFVRYTPLGWLLHGKRSFP